MPRFRKNPNDPFDGQTFWTRRGGADLSAEVDYDRPCPVCGYNLRGRPLRSRCPECGSIGGWNLYDEPIPWDDRRTLWAFLVTAFIAIRHPQQLARHVWCPQRLDLIAARKFRRIVLTVATLSLALTSFIILLRTVGLSVALITMPIDLIAVIVWLNSATIEPVSRFKDWAPNTRAGRRVHVVIHYASACMVLSPLHVLLAWLMRDCPDLGLLVPAMHLGLLMFQLWLNALVMGWLLYELVDIPVVQAHALSLGAVFTAIASAAITLVAVPATVAMIASHMLGG